MTTLSIDLTDETLELIARRAAELVTAQMSPAADISPWLDTKGAANHIAATPGRIHDLVQLGKLTPCRDGRRLLFRREDLDAYLDDHTEAVRPDPSTPRAAVLPTPRRAVPPGADVNR